MRVRLLLLLLAAPLLPSCKSKDAAATPSPSASAPTQVASSAVSAAASTTSPTQRLAFQKVEGSGLTDTQITQGQEALRRLPGKLDNWVLLGRLWVQKARESADPGFYLNAGACADEALLLQSSSALALGLKAQVALNEHRFSEALELTQRALANAPEDLAALGVKSDALLELGRFEEAAATAQQMMDLKPNLASYIRASYFRWLQGDLPGAKAAAKKAAMSGRSTRDPEPHAWAITQAAMIFWHEGDYEGALAGFQKALEEFPDYPPALTGKGRALLALGKAKEAAEALSSSLKKNPLVETAWLLGDARTAAGDEPGAKEAYEQAIARGRVHDPRTLALFFATKNRDPDEAVRLAQRELEHRGDLYTEDALGWALLRAGKPEQARPHLERATRHGTRDATLFFHRGVLELVEKKRAVGEKWLKDALKMNPKFDPSGADEATRLLKGEKK